MPVLRSKLSIKKKKKRSEMVPHLSTVCACVCAPYGIGEREGCVNGWPFTSLIYTTESQLHCLRWGPRWKQNTQKSILIVFSVCIVVKFERGLLRLWCVVPLLPLLWLALSSPVLVWLSRLFVCATERKTHHSRTTFTIPYTLQTNGHCGVQRERRRGGWRVANDWTGLRASLQRTGSRYQPPPQQNSWSAQ